MIAEIESHLEKVPKAYCDKLAEMVDSIPADMLGDWNIVGMPNLGSTQIMCRINQHQNT